MRTPTVILAFALFVASTMAEEEKIEPLKAVTQGAGDFSTALFKSIANEKKGENLISSPLSAHVVVSMAAFGAGGNTAKQMRQALHLPSEDTVARQGLENLIDSLSSVTNVTLEIANKVFVAKDFSVKSEYKELTSGTFRSEAAEIDITKPQESAKLVNDWASEKTHEKIKEILKDDDITPDSRLFLLNAIYFKGNWARQFEKSNTQDRTFHVDEKTEKQVPTMFASGSFVYGELPDLKAKFVELPYENKDLKMIIIVPDEINGLSSIEQNLESFNYSRLEQAGSETDLMLYLPKFKIESTIDLQAPLEQLGMTDMFSNTANFSGIADADLKVGKVLQKAFIEVNEEGSEAAAVTAFGFMPISAYVPPPPPILRADKPFFYEIRDTKCNIPLFTGFVRDPKI